jgi:two-component system, NarL family, sensor kinase
VAWQVGLFALAGLVAVALVGFATAVASRRVGEREAIVDARTTTLINAQRLVEPLVTEALVDGTPRQRAVAVQAIDDVVRNEELRDRSLARVKIWSRDGRIVYSDEARLVGQEYRLGEDEIAALDEGRIEAEVSDLTEPENRFERDHDKLLEVDCRDGEAGA